jgi:hypothetical protein
MRRQVRSGAQQRAGRMGKGNGQGIGKIMA